MFPPGIAPDQPKFFQLGEVQVEGGARHFAVGCQRLLLREAARVRVVPVAKVPKDDLRRGLKPLLTYRPISCCVAQFPSLSSSFRTRSRNSWFSSHICRIALAM